MKSTKNLLAKIIPGESSQMNLTHTQYSSVLITHRLLNPLSNWAKY